MPSTAASTTSRTAPTRRRRPRPAGAPRQPDDYDEALLIRDAVHADPVARVLLEGARRELSIFWTDEETGVECRARLDAPAPAWQT